MNIHSTRTGPIALLLIMSILFGLQTMAQDVATLSLDSCYAWSEATYPLLRQRGTIDLSEQLSLENIARGNLPQFNVGGQATYQSDVTRVPISIPGMTIPELPKDQYKVYGELSQPLTPLFNSGDQRQVTKMSATVEREQLAVEAYQLRERVNELFLAILLVDEQLKQVALTDADLRRTEEVLETARNNGVRTRADVDQVKAERIAVDQRKTELLTTRNGLIDALSILTGKQLKRSLVLEQPVPPAVQSHIQRPELLLMDAQKELFSARTTLLRNKTLPQFSLFVQGGYGRPALNMLSDQFDFYYIGGVRLNWSIGNYYTIGRERQLLELQKNSVELQRATFEQGVNLSLATTRAEIVKYEALLESDNELIEIRGRITGYSRIQLDNGTNTVNDYITALSAEDKARQVKTVHKIQLLMAQLKYVQIQGYE